VKVQQVCPSGQCGFGVAGASSPGMAPGWFRFPITSPPPRNGQDRQRQRIVETNRLGTITAYSYCNCGSLEYITNAAGTALQTVTHYVHDDAGRLSQIYYPDHNITNHYDSAWRVWAVTDAMGGRTNEFNLQGLVVSVSNSFGRVFWNEFNIHDLVTDSINANGVEVVMTYDELDRMLTRTYPDGGVEAFMYSARGLVAYTNQLTHGTSYAYDAGKRKTAETNANNEVVQFTYSPAGVMLTLTDGKSQQTQWKYDLYGRMTNKTDAASNIVFAYSYNANGWLTSRWTPAKGTTYHSFDAVGNMTGINYPNSPDITLNYDALNRLTNMVDAVGNSRFSYDSVGQLLSEDGPWASDTVSYTYNNRLRSSLTVQNPNGPAWSQSYAWDSVKHLTNITSPAGAFSYLFQSPYAMLPARLLLPNGAYITNTYDNMAHLAGTWLEGSNGVINAHEYVYNLGNQRTSVTRVDGSKVNYTYDNIGQLKTGQGAEFDDTVRKHEQFGYAYDAAGNLNYRTNNALLQTFDVNNLNQLVTVKRTNTLTVAVHSAARLIPFVKVK